MQSLLIDVISEYVWFDYKACQAAAAAALFVYVNHDILFADLWLYESREHTWWNVNGKIHTPIISTNPQKPWHASYSAAFFCFVLFFSRLLVFFCVCLCAACFVGRKPDNWFDSLFLFLDLNDIPGNFSNCHNLICSSSFFYVDGGPGGTAVSFFFFLRVFFKACMQGWWKSYCSLVSFSLYLLLRLLSETLSTNLSFSLST